MSIRKSKFVYVNIQFIMLLLNEIWIDKHNPYLNDITIILISNTHFPFSFALSW